MDLVNGTLLVQAFNFFIAYMLLKKLLLKPAVAGIQQELAYRNNLQATVDARSHALTVKEQEKQWQWHTFQQSFRTKIPELSVRGYVSPILFPSLVVQKLSEHETALLADQTALAIQERIGHVRR
jgi:hypothetical protein